MFKTFLLRGKITQDFIKLYQLQFLKDISNLYINFTYLLHKYENFFNKRFTPTINSKKNACWSISNTFEQAINLLSLISFLAKFTEKKKPSKARSSKYFLLQLIILKILRKHRGFIQLILTPKNSAKIRHESSNLNYI